MTPDRAADLGHQLHQHRGVVGPGRRFALAAETGQSAVIDQLRFQPAGTRGRLKHFGLQLRSNIPAMFSTEAVASSPMIRPALVRGLRVIPANNASVISISLLFGSSDRPGKLPDKNVAYPSCLFWRRRDEALDKQSPVDALDD